MPLAARAATILAMTRPDTSSKILLVADRRAEIGTGAPGPVRRFKLARLRHEAHPAGAAGPPAPLKQI
jgi:hypothetical protein